MCTDPTQAAVSTFSRIGSQLHQHDSLADHFGKEVDLFFLLRFLSHVARQAAQAASDVMALRRLQAPWVAKIHWGPVLAEVAK